MKGKATFINVLISIILTVTILLSSRLGSAQELMVEDFDSDCYRSVSCEMVTDATEHRSLGSNARSARR